MTIWQICRHTTSDKSLPSGTEHCFHTVNINKVFGSLAFVWKYRFSASVCEQISEVLTVCYITVLTSNTSPHIRVLIWDVTLYEWDYSLEDSCVGNKTNAHVGWYKTFVNDIIKSTERNKSLALHIHVHCTAFSVSLQKSFL